MDAVVVMSPEAVRELVRAVLREELAVQRDPEKDVLTAEQVADLSRFTSRPWPSW